MSNVMAMEKRSGTTAWSMMATLSEDKRQAWAFSTGPTEAIMKETLSTTIWKGMALTLGTMDANTKDFGKQTKCTEKVISSGKMGEASEEITKIIKRMDMANKCGPTVDFIRVTG